MKHTARYWLDQIDKNPEKFKTTRAHITEVNRAVKQCLAQQEKNTKSGEAHYKKSKKPKEEDIPFEEPELKEEIEKQKNQQEQTSQTNVLAIGTIVRVMGRIGRVESTNGNMVTIQFHTGANKEYLNHYVSVCRNQEEMQKKFKEAKKSI